MEERRRSPRRAAVGETAILPTALTVQVLDISIGGVMLASARPVEIGARGRLRLNVAGTPFAADVQIQWTSPAPGEVTSYLVGAMFVSIDPAHRQLIETFTS